MPETRLYKLSERGVPKDYSILTGLDNHIIIPPEFENHTLAPENGNPTRLIETGEKVALTQGGTEHLDRGSRTVAHSQTLTEQEARGVIDAYNAERQAYEARVQDIRKARDNIITAIRTSMISINYSTKQQIDSIPKPQLEDFVDLP